LPFRFFMIGLQSTHENLIWIRYVRLIKLLYSFEFVFVLWLFSYQYKNVPLLFNIVDSTLLLTAVLIPWGICLFFKQRNGAHIRFWNKYVMWFLGLSLWLIVTSFWSPSQTYKLQKTLCYLVYTVPAFLAGHLIMSWHEERVRRLLLSFVVFSAATLIGCYNAFFLKGMNHMLDIFNTNYLVTGQTLGVGLLLIIPWSFFQFLKSDQESFPVLFAFNAPHRNNKPSALHYTACLMTLFLSCLYLYVLFNLGGRGPVIASVICLGFFYSIYALQFSISKSVIHFCVLIFLSGTCFLLLNNFLGHESSHFAHRIAPLLEGRIDESLNERFSYYHSALRIFLNHPIIGTGLGGWAVTEGLGDVNIHPHNIFLEILSETGIIGLTLFLGLLTITLRPLKLTEISARYSGITVLLLLIFSLVNAQKSGDLHDNLLLFFSLSLCCGLPARLQK